LKRCLPFLLLLPSCSSAIQRTLHTPPRPLSITTVVVHPIKFTGESLPDWRAHEVESRLVATCVETVGDRLSFFGPAEIEVGNWAETSWMGSDAVAVLAHEGVRADQALILRAEVEKRVATQVHESEDAKGRRGAWSAEETTWLARVELIHPSSEHVLAELAGRTSVDQLAHSGPEDEFDPAPAMTRLLVRLASEAMAEVRPFVSRQVDGRSAPSSAVVLAQSPAGIASDPDLEVAKLDPLSAELWLLNRARFLNPSISDREAARLARLGPGLWVLGAPAGAPIRAGDLVIEVDGAPPLRQILARKRLTFAPVPVRVLRGGVEIDANVP
jgi:hypothetical protein